MQLLHSSHSILKVTVQVLTQGETRSMSALLLLTPPLPQQALANKLCWIDCFSKAQKA